MQKVIWFLIPDRVLHGWKLCLYDMSATRQDPKSWKDGDMNSQEKPEDLFQSPQMSMLKISFKFKGLEKVF